MKRLVRFALNLWPRGCRGASMIEFGLAAPVFMALGLYGLEAANLTLAHLRISQIASNLADTASRVGQDDPQALKRIRESDILDAFQAVRIQSGSFDVTTHGRVILSSLEQNAGDPAGQWIHWQRCIGEEDFSSSYGVEGDGETGTAVVGMGPSTSRVTAPEKSAVMFVEVQYRYQPLVSDKLFGRPVIKSNSAFLVRDRRDLSDGRNPEPIAGVTPATCDLFTT